MRIVEEKEKVGVKTSVEERRGEEMRGEERRGECSSDGQTAVHQTPPSRWRKGLICGEEWQAGPQWPRVPLASPLCCSAYRVLLSFATKGFVCL